MGDFSTIREHMEVIGADGVHLGTVDKVEGDRIKLTKKDSGTHGHEGHHHYVSRGLVADVEGDHVDPRHVEADDPRRVAGLRGHLGVDRVGHVGGDPSGPPMGVATDQDARPLRRDGIKGEPLFG